MNFLKHLIFLSTFALIWSIQASAIQTEEYESDHCRIWCEGHCSVDVQTETTKGIVLMGGGTDTKKAFAWQTKNANGGDFVVLRSDSPDNLYNSYIYNIARDNGYRLNSVTTIYFKSAKGSTSKKALKILRDAEAVFLAGGDQSDYINYWVGTEVQTILQEKSANITLGGTSAGCMVLGNWVFSAAKGTITSHEALFNPFSKKLSIVPAFLQLMYLDRVITDTHFVTRDRMGRMLTFMARIMQMDVPNTVRGIGIDEHTALLVHANGTVLTVGKGTAYVCHSHMQPTLCTPETPLTYEELCPKKGSSCKAIKCERLSGVNEDTYSFLSFEGSGVVYSQSIVEGKLLHSAYGPAEK